MASQSQQQEVARAAARGTLATLVLRLISFACTQWTFRVLDPATLGRASIQLELLLTTILFISREGFRLALTKNISSESWNVAWLSVPLATVVSVVALCWHLWVTGSGAGGDGDDIDIDYDYRWAGILYCLASCIEGWAEPAVLVTLRQMNIAVKASAEGLATVGKTVTIVVALRYLQNDWPVTAFGIAQMTYAIVYAVFLYSKTWSQLIGPKWNSFDRKTCYMTVVFTTQGFFKHLLTEGDRIVLTTLSGSYDQGVYAMGSAYGGMAARIILQPIEENARLLWSRLATQKFSSKRDTATDTASAIETTTDPLEQSYTVLVKLVLYVGLVFSCIAVNYTSVLLNLLAGRKWGNNAEANAVLSAFCVYTAFLAWNGMTEAFLYGVASSGVDMGRLGAAHTAIGVLFACVAPLAVTRYGATGLVAANCVAMFLRAIYSVNYAAGFFASRQQKPFLSTLWRLLDQMFPRREVILAFIGSYFATRASFRRLVEQADELQLEAGSLLWLRLSLHHVGVGIACAVGLVSLAFPLEQEFRRSARSTWHGKQD